MKTLHITNGDNTVSLLRDAAIEGDMLPWRDVLHMGPVPFTTTLTELSEVRAQFIASQGWADTESVSRDFKARDRMLDDANQYDEIWLWFEHDLYDQLQLIQVLTELSVLSISTQKIHMVVPDTYLGHHTPDQVPALQRSATLLTDEQMNTASEAWRAFRDTTPVKLAKQLAENTASLPFLRAALQRGLMELPAPQTGLTKTEAMILELVSEGFNDASALFTEYCRRELAMFHGDMGFFQLVKQMTVDTPPLVAASGGEFSLTEEGQAVLGKTRPWQRAYSAPQWLGGYQLNGVLGWTWDNTDQTLVPPPESD